MQPQPSPFYAVGQPRIPYTKFVEHSEDERANNSHEASSVVNSSSNELSTSSPPYAGSNRSAFTPGLRYPPPTPPSYPPTYPPNHPSYPPTPPSYPISSPSYPILPPNYPNASRSYPPTAAANPHTYQPVFSPSSPYDPVPSDCHTPSPYRPAFSNNTPPNTTTVAAIKRRTMPVRPNGTNDEREALFGGARAKRSAQASYEADRNAHGFSAVMEEENDRRVEELSQKVSRLKELGHSMQGEIRNSNTLVTNMGSVFDNVGPMLSGTVKKLQHILQGGGGWHMWWIMIFVVILIFVLYWLAR